MKIIKINLFCVKRYAMNLMLVFLEWVENRYEPHCLGATGQSIS